MKPASCSCCIFFALCLLLLEVSLVSLVVLAIRVALSFHCDTHHHHHHHHRHQLLNHNHHQHQEIRTPCSQHQSSVNHRWHTTNKLTFSNASCRVKSPIAAWDCGLKNCKAFWLTCLVWIYTNCWFCNLDLEPLHSWASSVNWIKFYFCGKTLKQPCHIHSLSIA